MALTLDDFKQFALDNAGASDNGQAPPAQPMPNINPLGALQIDNPVNQGPPPTPDATAVQPKQGPIKSFLTQFIHGAGQGLLSHVGLQTDAERQQVQFNQAQQQAAGQRAQQLQAAQIQNYQGLEQQRQAGEKMIDTSSLGIPGLPPQIQQKDLPRVLAPYITGQAQIEKGQNKNDVDREIADLKYGNGDKPGPLNTVFKDINGRSVALNKKTLEVLKDFGPSNSVTTAYARAKAMAQYGIVNTMDQEGNPTSVSRLDAITNNLPTASFDALKSIGSDKVGIQQYEDILKNKIQPNLSVLDNNNERIAIAHTLEEADKNPGAIQSLITSGLQSGALSQQGAALVGGILQSREFGSVARKYGGNMNGTEGLQNRIQANQASPLNSRAVNQELINNDLEFTKKAQAQLGKVTGHRSSVAAPNAAPNGTPSTGKPTHRYNPVTQEIEAIP